MVKAPTRDLVTDFESALGEVVVRIDQRYFRPAEVKTLLGDPTKAQEKLGWTPTTTLEELVG
jgi:GDPmannose 4,6-dehydratase